MHRDIPLEYYIIYYGLAFLVGVLTGKAIVAWGALGLGLGIVAIGLLIAGFVAFCGWYKQRHQA